MTSEVSFWSRLADSLLRKWNLFCVFLVWLLHSNTIRPYLRTMAPSMTKNKHSTRWTHIRSTQHLHKLQHQLINIQRLWGETQTSKRHREKSEDQTDGSFQVSFWHKHLKNCWVKYYTTRAILLIYWRPSSSLIWHDKFGLWVWPGIVAYGFKLSQ